MPENVIKRDGLKEPFNPDKIKNAMNKAYDRQGVSLNEKVLSYVIDNLPKEGDISVNTIHLVVDEGLRTFGYDFVADTYNQYVNYKTEFVTLFEDLHKKAKTVINFGDRENANFESSLISTQQSIIRRMLTKELYQRNYLDNDVKLAFDEGYLYGHDLSDLLFGGINCVEGSSWVTIREAGKIETIRLDDLKDKYKIPYGVTPFKSGVQVLSRNGWADIKGVSRRPLAKDEPCLEIKSRSGLKLKVTKEHRIPILDADGVETVKLAKDIKKGDYLLSETEATQVNNINTLDLSDYVDDKTYIGNLTLLKAYINYKYKVSGQKFFKNLGIVCDKNLNSITVDKFRELKSFIDIPYDIYNSLVVYRLGASKKLPLLLPVSKELARMIGYVVADGSVSKSESVGCYQVNFSSTKYGLLEDFLECVKKVFPDLDGVKIRPPCEKSTTPCSRITIANGVVWDFFNSVKRSAGDITIPSFITDNTEEIKLAFLGAAMDCDGSVSDKSVKYATACEEYAEQFTLMLSSLGFNPTNTVKRVKGTVFIYKGCESKRNYDTFYVNLHNLRDINNWIEYTKSYKTRYYKITDRTGIDHNPCKVRSVTEVYKEADVYDLETSDNWFITNGFIVHNCSLFDIGEVLSGGFEMANLKYREPSGVLSALQLIGDITLAASAQQYGGFSLSEIDKVLLPYVYKSHQHYLKEAITYGITDTKTYIENMVDKELRQGFQSLEMKLNSVPSSRGDFAFTTLSFGNLDLPDEKDTYWQQKICMAILNQRMGGEPVVFPKLVMLFSQEQNDKCKLQQELFDKCIQCSCVNLYPDYLAIDTMGEVSDIYKKYGKVVTPMGRQ